MWLVITFPFLQGSLQNGERQSTGQAGNILIQVNILNRLEKIMKGGRKQRHCAPQKLTKNGNIRKETNSSLLAYTYFSFHT